MDKPFDEYVDQMTIAGGIYGIALNFLRTSPKPALPGSVPVAEEVGSLRMSLEHFKVITFLLKRQVDEIERQMGIQIPIPAQLMNALRVPPEDWDRFWARHDQ